MNVEQLKEYLAKIPNTQKAVQANGVEVEIENLKDDPDSLKINTIDVERIMQKQ